MTFFNLGLFAQVQYHLKIKSIRKSLTVKKQSVQKLNLKLSDLNMCLGQVKEKKEIRTTDP